MPEYLGVDAGTSFLKAAVLNIDSMEVRSVQRTAFPDLLPSRPSRHVEADPEDVLRKVETLLDGLLENCPNPAGIVLCGQMHGVVLVDSSGNAASPYMPWLDARVPPAYFNDLSRRLTPRQHVELGNEFRPNTALPLLHWLKAQDVTPVSIADYVAAKLCNAPPILDPTQAAAFGALHLDTLSWHQDVLAALDLDRLRWPAVRPPGSPIGSWRGIPCYPSIGDQQCALAGALLAQGELAINIGTGSQVARLGAPKSGDQNHQVRPYFDGAFLHTITHIPGGRALSALVKLLSELGGIDEAEAWPYIDKAVDSVRETDARAGMAFYPGACGQTGFLDNLHEGNLSVGHIFRAAYESMACNYEACAHRLDPDKELKQIVYAGGVARRNTTLRDLISAQLELPYRLSPHAEDTLVGLLVFATALHRGSSVQAVAEALRAAQHP